MATGKNLSGSSIPYPYLRKLFVPAKIHVPAHGYEILPIPVPARVKKTHRVTRTRYNTLFKALIIEYMT